MPPRVTALAAMPDVQTAPYASWIAALRSQ
jgi:hypothetical protein